MSDLTREPAEILAEIRDIIDDGGLLPNAAAEVVRMRRIRQALGNWRPARRTHYIDSVYGVAVPYDDATEPTWRDRVRAECPAYFDDFDAQAVVN